MIEWDLVTLMDRTMLDCVCSSLGQFVLTAACSHKDFQRV